MLFRSAGDVIERRTHATVVGRVRHTAAQPAQGALLYWRGVYDRIEWSAEEVSRAVVATSRNGRAPLRAIAMSSAPPLPRTLDDHARILRSCTLLDLFAAAQVRSW